MNHRSFYIKYIKLSLDFMFAIFLTILLLPVLIIISLGIYLNSGCPIFFLQTRVGLNLKEFKIIKFRTMPKDTKELTSPEAREIKIDFFGKFLRRFSLDEIPQIFNILKGEMSFVGPRPILTNMKRMIDRRKEENIFSIKPGITGLAQVKAYDEMTVNEKIEFEKIYRKNISFLFDIYIMISTFFYLFKNPPSD